MLDIQTLQLSQLQTNCYIVSDHESGETMIIDPADSGDLISQKILEGKLKLSSIVLTHGHFDHLMGLLELQLNFPDVPCFVHSDDVFLIEQAQQNAEYWLKMKIDPVPVPKHFLTDGTEFELGKSSFKVIHTPGHTPGSICLLVNTKDQTDDILFTGDTIFKDGVGRTDFKYSRPLLLEESISRLQDLIESNTQCHAGHGEHFTFQEFIDNRENRLL